MIISVCPVGCRLAGTTKGPREDGEIRRMWTRRIVPSGVVLATEHQALEQPKIRNSGHIRAFSRRLKSSIKQDKHAGGEEEEMASIGSFTFTFSARLPRHAGAAGAVSVARRRARRPRRSRRKKTHRVARSSAPLASRRLTSGGRGRSPSTGGATIATSSTASAVAGHCRLRGRHRRWKRSTSRGPRLVGVGVVESTRRRCPATCSAGEPMRWTRTSRARPMQRGEEARSAPRRRA